MSPAIPFALSDCYVQNLVDQTKGERSLLGLIAFILVDAHRLDAHKPYVVSLCMCVAHLPFVWVDWLYFSARSDRSKDLVCVGVSWLVCVCARRVQIISFSLTSRTPFSHRSLQQTNKPFALQQSKCILFGIVS